MSKYFSNRFNKLVPYSPGEQPSNMKYIKLNTNESPFPPSENALNYAMNRSRPANLYSDPECIELRKALASLYEVDESEVILSNGSDEILNFSFMAFCDDTHPAAFPDITYGFYPVFAQVNNIPYFEIPLAEDFSVDYHDYLSIGKTIFIANPNAPTGISVPTNDIEKILESNPNNIVVIDEAYVDFGGESCIPLIKKYENLLVVQTFSKSRSMAGARLGFAIGNKKIISDLNTLRYSTNPYNINSMTLALGYSTILDHDYTLKNCAIIKENRNYTVAELSKRGFTVLPSKANFVFAKHNLIDGNELYLRLKDKGILVRYFAKNRIDQYIRITIGTMEQMVILMNKIDEIMDGI